MRNTELNHALSSDVNEPAVRPSAEVTSRARYDNELAETGHAPANPAPADRAGRGEQESASAVHHVVAERLESGPRRDVRQPGNLLTGHCDPVPQVRARRLHRGVGTQQAERLGVQRLIGQVGGEQFAEPLVTGTAGAQGVQHGEAPDSLAQVGSGRLAGLRGLAGHIQDVVGQLPGDADRRARRLHPRGHLGRGPGEHRSEPARRRDQRPRLLFHHPQVVRERILARRGTQGLGDLSAHQPGERVRLDPDRLIAEVGEDLRRTGEQEVAGEDGDRVGPPGVRARVAAADRRLVHHVVVVQRGQVGQFDRHRRGDDPPVARVAEVGRKQHERGTEPLAPGVDQMPGRLGQQRPPQPGPLRRATSPPRPGRRRSRPRGRHRAVPRGQQ